MKISWLRLVRQATLETLRLRSYILFQMLRDKTIFFLAYSAELLPLRTLNFPQRVSPRESTVSELLKSCSLSLNLNDRKSQLNVKHTQ